MAGLAIIGGLLPPALAWTKKLMIDGVVTLATSHTDAWSGLWLMAPLLGLILCWLLLNSITLQGRSLAEKNLRAKLGLRINELIIGQALKLDLSHFENTEFYDKLQNARRESDQRALDMVVQSFNLIQMAITFAAFTLLILRFSPWLLLIIFGVTLPSFAVQNKYGQLTFRLLSGQAPERRHMQYFEELLTVDQYAKEVKLFGLGRPLLARYLTLFWQLFRADMHLAWRRSLVSIAWAVVALVGYLAAIAWIIFRAIDGSITFGDAILYLEVFEQTHYLAQLILLNLIQLYENSLFISNVFAFLALEPRISSPAQPRPVPAQIQQGLEFRGVSFRYPGQAAWSLRDINLTLCPNEKLALVGLNGAGKTTLIKLLTRLYDPTEGQILLDGVELRNYDLNEWRQKIGVIFQDFVRYQFTAAENVGVGQVEAWADQAQIVAAAHKGGAHEFLAALPNGYQTMLGKWFEDGQELSLGQWQRVALSRAFMRRAEILILDEPTAALDAEQEYHIFQRFRQLTANKTAILISHRFSTVRMADRIAVIEAGRLTELGSHVELMAGRGTYAHLFNLQAQGYQ